VEPVTIVMRLISPVPPYLLASLRTYRTGLFSLVGQPFSAAHFPYSDSGESISKGDIHSCCCARACGNVKNLSLLTGYTVGGRRPEVMNNFP